MGRWRVKRTLEALQPGWKVEVQGDVVLWGARRHDVQLGSADDRQRQLRARIMASVLREAEAASLRGTAIVLDPGYAVDVDEIKRIAREVGLPL